MCSCPEYMALDADRALNFHSNSLQLNFPVRRRLIAIGPIIELGLLDFGNG